MDCACRTELEAMKTKASNNLMTVTQSNLLIEASYQLTLEEKRLIIVSIARIDSRKPLGDGKPIKITAETYSDIFKLDVNSTYGQLQRAAEQLFDREIKFKDEETGDQGGQRWVSKVVYHKRQGAVSLWYSEHVMPYLSNLHSQFTPYKLENVRSIKSVYAIRLYELVSQYSSVGRRWITVKDFRDMFQLHDKYKNFSDLKRWVLNPSIKELNRKSNYDISFDVEKAGRAVNKIILSFKEKDQLAMDV